MKNTLSSHIEIVLNITHLAGLGDGVATYEGRTVFVPYVCADEQVRAALPQPLKEGMHAQLQEIISPSAERIAPACQHYTQCGGCRLQHVSAAAYQTFKLAQLQQALKPLGENLSLQPFWSAGAQARRRVDVAVQISKGQVLLGFHQPRSHAVVDVQHCPVMLPEIEALLPPLRALISSFKKPSAVASVQITLAANGVDILLHLHAPLAANDKLKIQAWAAENGVVRVVTQQEKTHELLVNGVVYGTFGGVRAELPIGSFLQATHSAQERMIELVLEHTSSAKNVMDIYSGAGTFSLPLAQSGKYLSAYEGEAQMVAALHNAARQNGLESTVKAEMRDLYRAPIVTDSLSHMDAIVINPPRNGAEPQAKEIAKSAVKKVVMVSCNPSTFARDAGWLLRGGYQLDAIYPIDQFVWSAHLELVGVFTRA